MKIQNSETKSGLKYVFLLGGISLFIVFGATLADIIIGSSSGADLTTLPETAVDRFAEFKRSPLMGLYHLDLLNMIIALLMIPVYAALVLIMLKEHTGWSFVVFSFFIIGTALFVSGNTSLAMLQLSNKYFVADESRKVLIAAAGEALLAQGEHGTPGVFIGFSLLSLSSLGISLLMLVSSVFKNTTAWFGILGSIMLLIYLILVTFFHSAKNFAVIIAAPGGLMMLAWYIKAGIRLIKEGLH